MGPEILAQVSTPALIGFVFLALIVGAGAVFAALTLQAKAKNETNRQQAQRIVDTAQSKAHEIVRAAEVETKATFLARQEEFDKQTSVTRNEIREAEKR